jgi:two-component system OmpR family sensor kinase
MLALILALLLVSCGAVFVASTLAVRHSLTGQLDARLRTAAATYALTLGHPDHDSDDDREGFDTEGQSRGTLGARAVDGQLVDGGIVGDDGTVDPLPAKLASELADIDHTDTPRTVNLPGLGRYRILATAEHQSMLITGLPADDLEDTERKLQLVELAVFGAALLLTGLVGGRLVRLSLRPLTNVTRTAHRVADLPLSQGDVALHERVPNPAAGTEVDEVAGAFNQMLDHVATALTKRQHSEQRLRQFVADASHELRTPVAVIRSHAEYALRDPEGLGETAGNALRRIEAEATRTGALVESLLLLARLDAGRPLQHDEVDLTLLVLDAADDLRVSSPDHRWELDLPEDPVVIRGDAHALHQVMANVLGNASLHTPPGTRVEVALTSTPDAAILTVTDDGPGIPADVLPRVFERFVRADDARSRTAGSTGLGLAIAHAIIQAHGGAATASSRPGRTQFTIRLPSAAPS